MRPNPGYPRARNLPHDDSAHAVQLHRPCNIRIFSLFRLFGNSYNCGDLPQQTPPLQPARSLGIPPFSWVMPGKFRCTKRKKRSMKNLRCLFSLAALSVLCLAAQAQTWTKLTNTPPGYLGTAMVLTDGTWWRENHLPAVEPQPGTG